MPLMPKRTKFRKTQRGNRGGNAQRGTDVSFGDYALQSLGRSWMSNRQIEACRISINRYLKRKGKVWIRSYPHKSVTAKPAETRQGKGKGAVDRWVAVIRPGAVIFEIAGVPEASAKEALRLASNKLGFRTRFIVRNKLSN